MALTDRLMHPTNLPVSGLIPVHQFTAGFMLWCNGEVTRNQFLNRFNITASGEINGVDALKAKYDSLGTEIEKIIYIWKLEAAGLFYEDGTITDTKYKTIMDFNN
jgi:hypothetical protein